MNKLLSEDKEMQKQALDDLGFIIPIFMISNLQGDKLITYLKAKLEAAKTVKFLIEREREIRERVKAEEDEKNIELVERAKPKRAKEKNAMYMALDEDGNSKDVE